MGHFTSRHILPKSLPLNNVAAKTAAGDETDSPRGIGHLFGRATFPKAEIWLTKGRAVFRDFTSLVKVAKPIYPTLFLHPS